MERPPPPFWQRSENQWVLKTMFKEIPLPNDWPRVCLPTRSPGVRRMGRYVSSDGGTVSSSGIWHAKWGRTNLPLGGRNPLGGAHGNFNFVRWDPMPVTVSPLGDSAFGVSQLVGNGWEWTSTIFHPLEGFEPIPTYPGYSSRFFDQDHYVVKGGGPLTAACLLRRSFRNWFRPGYPHAHAGFRCVQN